MRKRIIFVSLGTIAFGETIIALQFARRLPVERFACHFIVAPHNKVLLEKDVAFTHTVLQPNESFFNKLRVYEAFNSHGTDLVVLSDYLTLAFSISEFGITLDLLRESCQSVISFDCYEWDSTDYVLDFLDGREKPIPIRFSHLDGVLRPCPLNRPQSAGPGQLCYAFLDPELTVQPAALATTSKGKSLPDGTGMIPNERVVFSTVAPWEQIQQKKNRGWGFPQLVVDLIQEALMAVERTIHWVRVGEGMPRMVRREGSLTIHQFPALPPPAFDALLSSADLLLTTNVAATTLAKRVLFGGSALLLSNSVYAMAAAELSSTSLGFSISNTMKKRLTGCYPIRPFRMFPLGWRWFLEPVLDDSPYLETFVEAEILDYQAVIHAIEKGINNVADHLLAGQKRYRKQLAHLPKPEECINHFL